MESPYHNFEEREPASEAEFLEIDYPNALYRKAFAKLPQGVDNRRVAQMRDELLEKAADGDWALLTRLLTLKLGAGPGLVLQNLIFWSGKSHAPCGWVYKSREDFEDPYDGLGLGHGVVEKARQILRGEKKWNKQTFNLVEESRPSRRIANFYRVDLAAVAELLGVELSREATEIDDFDIEEFESPFNEATESPFNEATESPFKRAATDDTSYDPFRPSSLQDAPEPAFAEPGAPKINKDKEPKEALAPPIEDKRHSQDSDTSSTEQAVREQDEIPPKPDNAALLDEIRDILNADSGRWLMAKYIMPKHPAEVLAQNMLQDELSDVVQSAAYEDLLAAITYVRWEEEAEVLF